MSDRYLFRGQDLNTGEWIEGDIVARSEGCTYIGQLELPAYDCGSIGCGVEDKGCSDRYEGAEYGYALCEGEMLQNVIACNPETVGQCTGLKDINGTLIFEGDIIDDRLVGVGEVIFNRYAFKTSFKNNIGKWFSDYLESEIKSIKIIGNIHEEAANE